MPMDCAVPAEQFGSLRCSASVEGAAWVQVAHMLWLGGI